MGVALPTSERALSGEPLMLSAVFFFPRGADTLGRRIL
jgi:hypothetical protein